MNKSLFTMSSLFALALGAWHLAVVETMLQVAH